MNPIFKAAADSLSGGWVMGLMTLVFLGFFVAWTVWAWLPRNREKMEAAARMPLDDGDFQGGEA
jgi:cbb3-type cytochrome oxidase subunit 3